MLNLFPQNKEVSVHEVLKRSTQFLKSYNTWRTSDRATEELAQIKQSYQNKLLNMKPSIDIEIYRSPYANGLIIYPVLDKKSLSVRFLMEYIREILENEGYRLVHADRKTMENGKDVKAIEKYYLKPPVSATIPIDQLFGNVILELNYKNNNPSRFKMIANIYSDRLYNEARTFEDLITLLFEERSWD